MCLYVNKPLTEITRAARWPNGERMFWKQLYLEQSPRRRVITPFADYPLALSTNRLAAEHPLTKRNFQHLSSLTSGGIHVLTRRPSALPWRSAITVPVWCRKQDLIAMGERYDAMFTQIFFNDHVWQLLWDYEQDNLGTHAAHRKAHTYSTHCEARYAL